MRIDAIGYNPPEDISVTIVVPIGDEPVKYEMATIYTKLCEQANAENYSLMCDNAKELGANAIISMRYDATELMAGSSAHRSTRGR